MAFDFENIKSLNGCLWKTVSFDERKAELLSQKFGLPPLVAQILTQRGIGADEAMAFLEPKIQSLMPNPFVLKDMEKASRRIAEAVIKKQKVAVIGDYDVDGATSSSVLRLFLESVGVEPIAGRRHLSRWAMLPKKDWTLLCLTIMRLRSCCRRFMPLSTRSVWMKIIRWNI